MEAQISMLQICGLSMGKARGYIHKACWLRRVAEYILLNGVSALEGLMQFAQDDSRGYVYRTVQFVKALLKSRSLIREIEIGEAWIDFFPGAES